MERLSQDEIKAICDAHEIWLSDNTKGQRADFARMDLTGYVFKDVDLEGAIFSRAYLDTACFTNVNLVGANFTGAYLRDAQFVDSTLDRAILERTDLACAAIKETSCDYTNFTCADLFGVDMCGTSAFAACFERVEAQHANFSRGNFINASFSGAELVEAKFCEANLSHCKFIGSDLSGADFTDANRHETIVFGYAFDGKNPIPLLVSCVEVEPAEEHDHNTQSRNSRPKF
jgi:uncharacterized protein YjbI with pentapeptide repeats